jgi:hypothetical protein
VNNQPPNENPKRKPSAYSCPSIEADTPKDFVAEVSRACPAIRPYLERLVTADRIMSEGSSWSSTVEKRSSLTKRWRELWRST